MKRRRSQGFDNGSVNHTRSRPRPNTNSSNNTNKKNDAQIQTQAQAQAQTQTHLDDNDNDDGEDFDSDNTCNNKKQTKIDGQAIFCLHDDNPNWIQGYFVAKGSTKPWGMLAIQEDVDDCMICCAGGYRRLSLTVYHRHHHLRRRSSSSEAIRRKRRRQEPSPRDDDDDESNQSSSSSSSSNEIEIDRKTAKPWKVGGIDWTGGDMMALYHPDFVDMKGERLFTGEKALPMMRRYFQNLIHRLEKEFCVEECSSVLDWLPNVAIVTGPMSLTIPP